MLCTMLICFSLFRQFKSENFPWVPIISTSKVSNCWIRDLRFNPRILKNKSDIKHTLSLLFFEEIKTQYFFPYSTCCSIFDEILFNIDYVIKKIKWINHVINWKVLTELEYKNLTNNFASQKTRKIVKRKSNDKV